MNKSKEYEKKKKSEKGTGRQDPERKWYKTNSWKQCAFKWNDFESDPLIRPRISWLTFTRQIYIIDLTSKLTNHLVQYPVEEKTNMNKNKLNLSPRKIITTDKNKLLKKRI